MKYTGKSEQSNTLVFPEYLRGPTYKNRKFTLNVLENKLVKDTSDAVARLKSEVANIATSSYHWSNKTVPENIKNLRNNAHNGMSHTIYSFVLPLPNTFSDSQSHTWNTDTGLQGVLGRELMNKKINYKLPSTGGKKLSRKSKLVRAAKGFAGEALGGYDLGTALGQLSQVTSSRKPLMSPGYFQNYTGSTPREFSFSFDFIPNSAEEAKSIIEIILKIKEFASPWNPDGHGVALLAPHWFDIEIGNEYITGMANLHGVVLKTITVDYGADGAMQFLGDGVPKYIKMDLTFAERKMVTSNDYQESQKNIKTG